LLNGNLYFAMTGTVADGLPDSGHFSATFGIGAEYPYFTQDITIRLVKSAGSPGTPTTVTVGNFHAFTLE
jgi:hypothetical protein